MDETDIHLREAVSNAGISSGTRFDWDKGIVYNVVLLGKISRNGFKYSDQAIDDAYKLAESAGSYMDHSPDANDNSRKLRENFGKAHGLFKNSSGELCAKEYHFNTKHAGAEDFKWACQHIPNRIGFSIIADAKGKLQPDGYRLVERITKVDSFDVVDQPATTSGIFNLKESVQVARDVTVKPKFDWNVLNLYPDGTCFTIGDGRPYTLNTSTDIKLQEQKAMTTAVAATVTPNPHAEIDIKLREQTDKLKYALEIASKSEYEYVRLLAKTVDDFQLREAEAKRKEEREKLLTFRVEEAKKVLKNDEAITQVFREQLANAKNDDEVKQLIDDRAKFVLREQDSTIRSNNQDNNGLGSGGNVKELTNKYFG